MFRRQGKVAGAPRCMEMEVINYKYSDRQLVADKNIDEVLERTWSRLGSNFEKRGVLYGPNNYSKLTEVLKKSPFYVMDSPKLTHTRPILIEANSSLFFNFF